MSNALRLVAFNQLALSLYTSYCSVCYSMPGVGVVVCVIVRATALAVYLLHLH